MDARGVELINLELDGRLDAAGRTELDAVLANDPAARARREQLRAVARALADAPVPSLPLDFADSVLRQLPQRSNRVRIRRYWRTGLALAASIVAAMVVLNVVQQPVPRGQVAGALAPDTPTVTVDALPAGLALHFDLPDGPADIVIDVVGTAAGNGNLAATTDIGIRPRVEGRRIVVPGVAAGRTTVVVTGDVAGFAALVVRGGAVTAVTVRSP
ncbi:MAG: anti-sigma factor family protein [Nevskiaceae bacterium]